MTDCKLIQPELQDWTRLEQIAAIDSEAFGCDGISVFNLLQFQYCGMVFALEDPAGEIMAESIVMRNAKDSGAWIFGFAVARKFQRRGAGTRLLSLMKAELKKQGISYIELTMNPEKEALQRLYIKNGGFRQEKVLEKHPVKQEPRWLIHLDLA